jgi:hypothetical protein
MLLLHHPLSEIGFHCRLCEGRGNAELGIVKFR